jgi:cell division protein FtsI (penicillin-binding protein 3)
MRRSDPVRRLNIVLVLVAFVLSLFAGRLVQLQGIESQTYAQKAVRQRLVTMDLPAIRGKITDRFGAPLAMTVDARAIYADPTMIDPAQKGRIAGVLAPLLDVPAEDIARKISVPNSAYEVLARGVSPERARRVSATAFKGIGAVPEYRRVYPGREVAANVVGFVGSDGTGLAGLEYGLNKLLAGRDGWQRVEISRKGQHIPMGTDQRQDPVPGRGVRLTIDRDIQWRAQQAIARKVRATQARNGSVIVMDPRTGEIIAMATAPTFDPAKQAQARRADIQNNTLTEVFEPGSTNKVITAAAAMEDAGVRADTVFTVPWTIRREGRPFRDSHPHPTRRMTFGGVLATSSNIGTILAGERVTKERLYGYLRAFGFGQPTGLRFPGESPGLLHPPARWYGGERYTVSFGQGVSVNALQMASVYATIANGGLRVAPTLVAGTLDEEGNLTPARKPPAQRVISPWTATELSRILEGVTTAEGTAPAAKIPGYRVAGKTGTAERVNPACACYRRGGYTASFVGYAPADAPQLVAQVVLQDPKRGHYGGEVAAPVFREVMSFALQSRKIPPTGSRSPKIRIYADQ